MSTLIRSIPGQSGSCDLKEYTLLPVGHTIATLRSSYLAHRTAISINTADLPLPGGQPSILRRWPPAAAATIADGHT